jgi:hypothetical protein
MGDSIKGIRTALLAAPESAEARPEDAEEEYAGLAGGDHAAGTRADEDKSENVSGDEVCAVGAAETDAVGYLLAVQVHRYAYSCTSLCARTDTGARICASAGCRHTILQDIASYLTCRGIGSAGDVVRLYAPPRQAEETAIDETGEGAHESSGESKTVAESKGESKADAAEVSICLSLCLHPYLHI